jgi:hypothetical protein
MACSFVTTSATAMSCGMAPNGSPRKSVSVPASTTRRPRSASEVTSATTPASRNCASSIATTCAPGSTRSAICCAESTGIASDVRPSWLETRYSPAYRSSSRLLNSCTRLRAIVARRTRRNSSSLFPLNITPAMTSIQPPEA